MIISPLLNLHTTSFLPSPSIISIYSLSESYFLYLLSLQKIAGSTLEGGLGNIGLAEPLRVYSNVEGGTGILGGNQHSETTITLNNPSKK